MKIRILIVSAFLFMLTLSGAYWAYSTSSASKYKYNTVTLSKTPQTSNIRVSAVINEDSLQPLYFKEDGFVTEILVKPGSKVKAGDILATLDINKVDLQYLQKLKNLKIDFITKNSVDSYFNKIKNLENSGFYSNDEAAGLKMNMAENVRSLLSLQEAITKLEARTEGKVIRAPTSGTITDVNWVIGEKVSSSKQVVPAISLRRSEPIFTAKLEISEDIAGQIYPGHQLELSLPLNQNKVTGTILSVSASTLDDIKNRYVPGYAKLDLQKSIGQLKHGMRLQGLVKITSDQNGVWVPRAAIDLKIPENLVSQTLTYFSKENDTVSRKLASHGGAKNEDIIDKENSISPSLSQSQNALSPNESSAREIYLLTGSKKIVKVLINDGPGDDRYTLINVPELEGAQVIVNIEPINTLKELFFARK